jgi:superoxide dismutase, Fe-Mn family
MPKHITRRNFVSSSVQTAAGVALSTSILPTIITACAGGNKIQTINEFNFSQQPLPYAYNALEDVIDAQTMEIHYSKHAAGYTKNLQEAVKAEAVGANITLEKLLTQISKYSSKMRNNAGGHYNHELFWKTMRPKIKNNVPTTQLLAEIEKYFTSFANFKKTFEEAGASRFGSGWVWLYKTNKNELKIGSTPNQDNPLMNNANISGRPILGLDVWEHAYYLKYQNKRAAYIQNWWDVVNWADVEKRLFV